MRRWSRQLGARGDFEGHEIVALDADQNFGGFKLLLEAFHQIGRERTKILFAQTADEEGAEYAAVAAGNAAVKGQAVDQPLLVAYDGNFLLIRVNGLNKPSDDLLQSAQMLI